MSKLTLLSLILLRLEYHLKDYPLTLQCWLIKKGRKYTESYSINQIYAH